MAALLKVEDLQIAYGSVDALKGVSLDLNEGEIVTVLGSNGAGKSTLARVLAGDSTYEVTKGEIKMNGTNLLSMSPDERAKFGFFLSLQNPISKIASFVLPQL